MVTPLDQINLDAHKLHVAVKAQPKNCFTTMFSISRTTSWTNSKALANAEEDSFLNGDGIGKPLGVLAGNRRRTDRRDSRKRSNHNRR